MRKKWLFLAPLAILGMLLFIVIGGEVVRQLWNWLLPPLFGWHSITFWQALGLLVLCRVLFGGFGVHGSRAPARRPLSERWKDMTPEERERFRGGMWGRLGFTPTTGDDQGGGRTPS